MAGLWKKYEDMDNAIKDIPMGTRTTGNKHSIPDVYGRQIQFYIALEDAYKCAMKSSMLDYKEVYIWRMLLSLVALKEHNNFPLMWEEVRIPGNNNDNLFYKALKDIPQYPVIADDLENGWINQKFMVLKWKDTDICLISPYTLLYPVADIDAIIKNNLLLKHLLDDVESIRTKNSPGGTGFGSEERYIIYLWLSKAESALYPENEKNDNETVRYHIQKFKEELGVDTSKFDEGNAYEIKRFGQEGDDKFYGKLRSIFDSVEAKIKIGEETFSEKEYFSSNMVFFTKNIFRNCEGNYKINGSNNKYGLLPISKDASKAYCKAGITPTGIDMRWEENERGTYICIKVSAEGAIISKIYQVCELEKGKLSDFAEYTAIPYDVTEESNMPIIAVWPKQIGELWKSHYIFVDGALLGGNLRADGKTIGVNSFVVETENPPYVVALHISSAQKEISVGAIAPERREKTVEGEAMFTADLAVDFGTSSTRIYAKINGNENNICEINISEDCALLLTESSIENIRVQNERSLRKYFIAGEASQEELLSMYMRQSTGRLTTVKPILDGIIYQVGKTEELEKNDGTYNAKVLANLKWSVGETESYYKAYIKQLCVHAASILYDYYQVGTINLKYSVSQSLQPDDRGKIKKIWTEDVAEYLQEHTERIRFNAPTDEVLESTAASNYYLTWQKSQVNGSKGFLIVDIGGGSTDVALWQVDGEKLKEIWHTAVPVAGRLMFTHWIQEYADDLCSASGKSEILAGMCKYLQETRFRNPYLKFAFTERIIAGFFERLLGGYKNEYLNETPWATELHKQIEKPFMLMLFALGYEVGTLLTEGKFTIPSGNGSFCVAFAGKGSRVKEWIDVESDSEANQKSAFRAGVEASAGSGAFHGEIINFTMSPNPKMEVGMGLLVNPAYANTDDCISNVELDLSNDAKRNEILKDAFAACGIAGVNYEDQIANVTNNYKGKMDAVYFFMKLVYHTWMLGDEV